MENIWETIWKIYGQYMENIWKYIYTVDGIYSPQQEYNIFWHFWIFLGYFWSNIGLKMIFRPRSSFWQSFSPFRFIWTHFSSFCILINTGFGFNAAQDCFLFPENTFFDKHWIWVQCCSRLSFLSKITFYVFVELRVF